MTRTLHLVGDAEADRLLATDRLALLIGMLLDQQVPMETAFAGPKKIADRLGGLAVDRIAEADPEEFAAVCATPPAIHRFPSSMAKRIQALCRFLLDNYGGDVEAIWQRGAPDGAEVLKRLKALPGFGEQKARIFLALLGKQVGIQPPGWREAAGPYGEQGSSRSIADVVDEKSLTAVRTFKRAAKAAAKKS
jgi:uncharacterized HhH-GPD family protein